MRARAIVFLAALAAPLAHAAVARADAAADKMACVRAYEDAQTLKKSGKLRASREKLELCKSDKCPEALRNDCKPWSREVEDALPTIVLGSKTRDGRDLVDVRVSADGEAIATKLDGWAVPIDPGVHVLRFEADGFKPADVRVVAREGEKRREVVAVLEPLAASAAPAPAPAPSTHNEPADSGTPSAPIPATAYVFAATGVVATGAFAYFALTGMSQKSDLDRCKPSCAESAVDDARRSFLMGDVALGVGVVAFAASAYFFFTRPTVAPAATSTGAILDFAPAPGGGVATVRGSF